MTPRPEVPREVWVATHPKPAGWWCVITEPLTDEKRAEYAEHGYTLHRYTPAPALLAPAQVEALEAALAYEGPRDMRYVTGLTAALSRIVEPDDWDYSVRYEDLCRWLLAAHARVGA